MPDHPVSRRTVALALASGVVGAKLASAVSSRAETPGEDLRADAHERHLLSPLVAGSRLLGWDVIAIGALSHGGMRVTLRGESGAVFGVEILARDGSPLAPRPPAQTDKFALFVSNGGDGRTPTAEEQGLAAMAMAQIVAQNEHFAPDEGFLTHGERIAEHSVAMLEHTPEEPPRTAEQDAALRAASAGLTVPVRA